MKTKIKGFLLLKLTIIFIIASFAPGCSPKVKKESHFSNVLNVYNWTYYIGETTISDFEKEFNIKVNYNNFSNNEEMLSKLQAGAKCYDVIFPSDYMVQIMIKQNLLAELDFRNIPNFKNISKLLNNLPFDPGNKYSVAYQWGTTGIGVNTAKVSEYVDSWDILWNEKYKGRISMLDDMRFGLIPALKKLGYSINTTKPSELEEAKNLMFDQKKLVKAYSSVSYIDLLKSGDIWISYGFSGDIFQVAKENSDVKYIIPKEGTNVWVDNMCIPKNAPHKKNAEIFINYILRPEVSAGISNFTWYSSPNEPAKEFIKKEILNNPTIYPPKEIIDKCEFLTDVGEATRLYDRIWNEIKTK